MCLKDNVHNKFRVKEIHHFPAAKLSKEERETEHVHPCCARGWSACVSVCIFCLPVNPACHLSVRSYTFAKLRLREKQTGWAQRHLYPTADVAKETSVRIGPRTSVQTDSSQERMRNLFVVCESSNTLPARLQEHPMDPLTGG